MSRRDRQADLRRRMAEARSKLSASSSSGGFVKSDTQSFSSLKKRPLEPSLHLETPTSSDHAGGTDRAAASVSILRPSKYSKLSETGVETDSYQHEEAPSGQSALGDLLGGYDDSSSENEEERESVKIKGTRTEGGEQKSNSGMEVSLSEKDCSGPRAIEPEGNSFVETRTRDLLALKPDSALKSSETSTVQNVRKQVQINTIEPAILPEENREKQQKLRGETTHEPPNNDVALPNVETISKTDLGVKESDKVSDEVWKEFNDLLDGEGDGSNEALVDVKTPSSDIIDQPSITATTGDVGKAEKKKKKKKKKKKESDPNKSVYDNDGSTNFEQASYEARVARLMLLCNKKKGQKSNLGGASEGTVPGVEGVGDLYDPSLAFQQEDNDDETEATALAKSDANAKGVSNETGSSLPTPNLANQSAASSSSRLEGAPSISLANVLRQRRDEARQLSIGGSGVSNSEQPSGKEDEAFTDGQWF